MIRFFIRLTVRKNGPFSSVKATKGKMDADDLKRMHCNYNVNNSISDFYSNVFKLQLVKTRDI